MYIKLNLTRTPDLRARSTEIRFTVFLSAPNLQENWRDTYTTHKGSAQRKERAESIQDGHRGN